MKKENDKSHSFLKIFTRKFSKTFPVIALVLVVFSVSAYAWLNNSAINKGNTIKTGETLAKIELFSGNQEVYSSDDFRELNQAVTINGKAGDTFTLRVSNSGEVAMRYVVSAVSNGAELVTMQDDGSGLKGNVLNKEESEEYTITLNEDSSSIILRLETSYTNTSPDELEKLLATTQETTETIENIENKSEAVTEKTENATAAPTEKVTEPVVEITEPSTEAAETPTEPTTATEATEQPTGDETTEATTAPIEATLPVVESVTDPTEVTE